MNECGTNEGTRTMETTHTLRKPVDSRRALQQRKKTLALCIFLALGIAGMLAMLLIGCGGWSAGADRRVLQQRSGTALVANRAVHQRDSFSSRCDESASGGFVRDREH